VPLVGLFFGFILRGLRSKCSKKYGKKEKEKEKTNHVVNKDKATISLQVSFIVRVNGHLKSMLQLKRHILGC
jgi:hypothetical protein